MAPSRPANPQAKVHKIVGESQDGEMEWLVVTDQAWCARVQALNLLPLPDEN
jgi:hypothetical protein